ncbi:helix-turn-helix domain-containing protein [Nonomuraea sp. NN258]|uniref:helix-turn-helix domain-containing protein n=1 Tax=Nonomuraea antri TaxID=2730852 RepID=UPI0015690195|nr:helix-turn-helix domain-containing protein [Nonomuraea antri]NRQ40744.1 helix-turn-helix domain-containing protein [Nonomuraea antri]
MEAPTTTRTARQCGAAKSRAKYAQQAANRREKFAQLRQDGTTLAAAAEQMGVSYEQARRWDVRLREENPSYKPPARSRTMQAARQKWLAQAQARYETYLELRAQGLEHAAIAERMGVKIGTIQRYQRMYRKAAGIDTWYGQRTAELRPRILAHLQQWPGVEFSAYDLQRKLSLGKDHTPSVHAVMRDLIAEGVAELVLGVRDRGVAPNNAPARRYRYLGNGPGSQA